MKKLGIEINGVLRDTTTKFKQIYEKHYVGQNDDDFHTTFTLDLSGNTELELTDDPFKYEIISEVTTLNMMNHFTFRNDEELFTFMYEEFAMELFGHAPSTETLTFNYLNDLYYNLRDENDIIIVSDEIGKSKPSSLFFLSKFGCLIEKVFFYSNQTKNSMWDSVDILLTANPDLLLNHPSDKIIIKFETDYNKQIESKYTIKSLSEFEEMLKTINEYV